MNYALYAIAALEVVGALCTVALIGKPRKPFTPADAVTRVILAAGTTVILVLAAISMH